MSMKRSRSSWHLRASGRVGSHLFTRWLLAPLDGPESSPRHTYSLPAFPRESSFAPDLCRLALRLLTLPAALNPRPCLRRATQTQLRERFQPGFSPNFFRPYAGDFLPIWGSAIHNNSISHGSFSPSTTAGLFGRPLLLWPASNSLGGPETTYLGAKPAFVPSASGSKPPPGRLFALGFFLEFLRPQLEKINQLGFFFLPMGGNTTRANVESLFEQAVFHRPPNQPVSGNPTRVFRRRTRFLPSAGGLKAPQNPPAGSKNRHLCGPFSHRFQTLVSRRKFTNFVYWPY